MSERERIYPVSVEAAADMLCGRRVLILCHVNPDGDALGSATALLETVRLTGGDGRVVTPSPAVQRLSFILGDTDTSYALGEEEAFEVLVTVDTASPGQLGELSFLADRVDLSIDHHKGCTLFSPYLLYPGEGAAAVAVYDILREYERRGRILGDPSRVLRRIFAAVASDTGSFKYSNTTPAVFEACADICRRVTADSAPLAPIDTMTLSDISARLFDIITEKDIAVRRLALNNYRRIAKGRIAISTVTAEEREAAGLLQEELGSMVDSVRSIEGTDVAVVLRESERGVYRGSVRANSDVDVSVGAAMLSGGGHMRAAGFTVRAESLEEAVATVERVFSEALPRDGGEADE